MVILKSSFKIISIMLMFLGVYFVSKTLFNRFYEKEEGGVKDSTYIIPDLSKWAKIKEGMSEHEVIDLLGAPIKSTESEGVALANHSYYRSYGHTVKSSNLFPGGSSFEIYIKDDKVDWISDPFGGVEISAGGLPSMPSLLLPYDNVVFHHYPRIIDFRWYSASGDYPVQYEVNVDTQFVDGSWSSDQSEKKVSVDGKVFSLVTNIFQVEEPFFCYIMAGDSNGRWRVRATNKKGKGDWSPYYHFSFKTGI